jgi:hypothetical protein
MIDGTDDSHSEKNHDLTILLPSYTTPITSSILVYDIAQIDGIMKTCSHHLLLLLVSLLKSSAVQGQFYAQVCQAEGLETLLQDDEGNFVLLHVDGHDDANNNITTGTDADSDDRKDDNSNSDWTRRRHLQLRRKPSSLGISVHVHAASLSRKQEDDDEDSTDARRLHGDATTTSNTTGITMLVRRCNCQGSSERVVWFCPQSSDLCGVPFDPNDPVGCYSFSIQQAVARNAWPLLVLWYIGLFLVLLCTIPGRTCRQYVTSCCWTASNQQRVDLLSHSQLTPMRNHSNHCFYWQNWWTWQQRRLERRILAQAQYQWRQELDELHGPTQLELKTKIYQTPETDKEENDNLDPPNTSDENNTHMDNGDIDNDAIDNDGDDDNDDDEHDTSCSICLAPLQTGERVGDLKCGHVFHVDCLKTWLPRRNTCPLCQAPGVAALRSCGRVETTTTPTPTETNANLNE